MNLFNQQNRRVALWALFALTLVYAFVAGLRTVADFDVGWLLATGRYLVTHHEVPRTEMLSYTAYGTPWIYPPFGGALLYLIYAAGGFAALSWVNALACMGVTAIAVGRPRLLTCSLAILAVPSIAFRTVPRAEIFTIIFFAAYLALLFRHDKTNQRPWLWLLPLIMLAWVNAHSGFSAGVALLGAYAARQVSELFSPSLRADAVQRLKRAGPWIVLSLLATLANPWGIGVYRALLAHNKLVEFQNGLVGEWSAVRLTAASFAGAFDVRDPNGGYWWLLVFAGVAALVALYRRQLVDALLLAGAAYLSLEHVRFQALFALVVIVVSAEVFSRPVFSFNRPVVRRAASIATAMAAAAFAALGLLHIADTVSNRSYLANGEFSTFGTGLSWWYPQRAAEYIEKNSLPGQLFNDYNSGGFLTLRLGPKYRDFADGRGIPFPIDVLNYQAALEESSPDSEDWTRAADRYGINTIILSIARSGGLEFVPLQQYCLSRAWKTVYLDEVSVVLVRNRPENQQWIARDAIDCATYRITSIFPALPSDASAGHSAYVPDRAERYNFYVNTASIYYVLGRDKDAADAASHAEELFNGDPGLYFLTGQLLQANGRLAEAEAQYRNSLAIRPTDMGWFLLGRLLLAEKKYPEAAAAVAHSADLAVAPANRFQLLGNIELITNHPTEALAAFDKAEQFEARAEALPGHRSFLANLAEGRGRAWLALHNVQRATGFAQKATQLAPAPQRWNLLADCYDAQGRPTEAESARNQAKEMSAR